MQTQHRREKSTCADTKQVIDSSYVQECSVVPSSALHRGGWDQLASRLPFQGDVPMWDGATTGRRRLCGHSAVGNTPSVHNCEESSYPVTIAAGPGCSFNKAIPSSRLSWPLYTNSFPLPQPQFAGRLLNRQVQEGSHGTAETRVREA